MSGTASGIFIFIDNSNIWIQAKKIEGMRKKFELGEDPRVRLDIGSLVRVLTKGNNFLGGFIFGSKPPSNDSFWNAIEVHSKCKVIAHERSIYTNQEKKVDTSMCVEMMTYAFQSKKTATVIAVCSGDLDYKPAIEKIVDCTALNIELWSWESSLSGELYRYAKAIPHRVVINYLDCVLREVIYTTWEFDMTLTPWQEKAKDMGVVITFATPFNNTTWKSDIENLASWPFKFFQLACNGPPTYVIIFEQIKKKKFNVQAFIEECNTSDFISYCTTYAKHLAVPVQQQFTEDWNEEYSSE